MRAPYDTVYVIDPDETVHDALTTLLASVDVRVSCFRTPEAFLGATDTERSGHCCVLLESDLSGIGSLALIRRLRAQTPDMPIIVLASTNDTEIAAQAFKAGALDVIEKPLVGHNLLDLEAGYRL